MYPVGALLTFLIPKELYKPIVAVVAGVFLYVGTGDLLTESHRRFDWKVIFAVVFGALVMYTVASLGDRGRCYVGGNQRLPA